MTRTEYMNGTGSNRHQEYYIQFATPGIKHFVETTYTKEQLKKLYVEDEHLNNLPGDWMKRFDMMTNANRFGLQRASDVFNADDWIKKMDGTPCKRGISLSDGCSAIKAYMREWAELN